MLPTLYSAQCPNCGNEAQNDAVFCDQCGSRLRRPAAPVSGAAPASPSQSSTGQAAAGNACPGCGASNTPGEMFCGECGTRLAAPEPEPAVISERPADESQVTEPNACLDCGAQLAEGDEFCYACGADLRNRPAGAPPASPPVGAMPPPLEAANEAPASAGTVARTGAEAAPAPAPPAPAADLAPPEAHLECPACGAETTPGDAFCDFCGAALTDLVVASGEHIASAAATAAPEVRPEVAPTRPRLVVADSGVELPLASGSETLVGREDPYSSVFPDIDLKPHGGEQGGVSRRHFKITLAGGQYRIEDLNSTNATMLNRQRLSPGMPVALADGDEVRAGRVRLIFRMAS